MASEEAEESQIPALDNNDWLSAASTRVDLPAPANGLVAFISDVHIPNQLKMEFEMAVCSIEEMRPDYVIIGGDFLDFQSVASFGYDPYRRNQVLQAEFDAARPYFRRLTRAATKSAHLIFGNHCVRLAKTIAFNPGLWGLRALNMRALAGLPDDLHVHPYLTQLQIGGMAYTHGTIATRSTAQSTFAKYGKSITVGHSHHAENLLVSQGGHEHQVLVSGTYQDAREARFTDWPNWQRGHVLVSYRTIAGAPLLYGRLALFRGDTLCVDNTFIRPTKSQRRLRER